MKVVHKTDLVSFDSWIVRVFAFHRLGDFVEKRFGFAIYNLSQFIVVFIHSFSTLLNKQNGVQRFRDIPRSYMIGSSFLKGRQLYKVLRTNEVSIQVKKVNFFTRLLHATSK